MKPVQLVSALAVALSLATLRPLSATGQHSLGIFEGHGDIGDVLPANKGSVVYDSASATYTVSGSGENMWSDKDAFQFVWTKALGDVELTADVSFAAEGKNPHRKAVLMVRQNLEADSAYVDVALHGVGLTSLQFREQKGGTTREVQATVTAPKQLRLVKHGDVFSMWLANGDGHFVLAGTSPSIAINTPFYVGIGVCSHDKDVVEKAVFTHVALK